MKLHNFGDELLFDSLPATSRPFQKVFITHLHGFPGLAQTTLKRIPTIYTTKTLAQQIRTYMECMDLKLPFVFVLLKPFQPQKLALSNGQCVEVLLCEGNDASHNLMVAIRKEKRILHLYAGNCVDIRAVICNDIAADWFTAGVEHLYLNLRRATDKSDERGDGMLKILGFIEKLFFNRDAVKIVLVLPMFGFENLIAYLAHNLRKHIVLADTCKKLYGNLASMEHFQQEPRKAKIFITDSEESQEDINAKYVDFRIMTIKIAEGEPRSDAAIGYYELQWSPLPSAFELVLLPALLGGGGPFCIHDISMHKHALPEYLLPFAKQSKSPTPKDSTLTKSPVKSKDAPQVSAQKLSPAAVTGKKCIRYLDDSEDDE